MMSIQEKCRVLDHQQVAPRYFKLTLSSAYISSHAEPGQFVNVKCSEDYDPLLRRALSIHRVSKEHKTFQLLYEVVGKGTELLSKYNVGAELDVLGPLGKGFQIDKSKKIAVLVGGGMGVAPLFCLAESLKETGQTIYVLIGASTKDCVACEQDFIKITDHVIISTNDGSYNKKGLVSDVLLEVLDSRVAANDAIVYACGPKAMLRAITEITSQKKIDCQVSMEQKMACGIGTCLGCVIKTKSGYKKVCDDGPVFDSKEIAWES
ncbi:dihydroorotate dehydrogenase electron transfer subunit [Candidatus Margulisiibacteriota bacterium]